MRMRFEWVDEMERMGKKKKKATCYGETANRTVVRFKCTNRAEVSRPCSFYGLDRTVVRLLWPDRTFSSGRRKTRLFSSFFRHFHAKGQNQLPRTKTMFLFNHFGQLFIP